MTGKEYLGQVYDISQKIKVRKSQLLRLREIAEGIPAAGAGVRVGGSGIVSRVADAVCKLVDLQEEISRDIDRLTEIYGEVEGRINALDNETYRNLLMLRYLCFKTWEEIAGDMNYGYQWIHKLHTRALVNFEKCWDAS